MCLIIIYFTQDVYKTSFVMYKFYNNQMFHFILFLFLFIFYLYKVEYFFKLNFF